MLSWERAHERVCVSLPVGYAILGNASSSWFSTRRAIRCVAFNIASTCHGYCTCYSSLISLFEVLQVPLLLSSSCFSLQGKESRNVNIMQNLNLLSTRISLRRNVPVQVKIIVPANLIPMRKGEFPFVWVNKLLWHLTQELLGSNAAHHHWRRTM